MEEDESRGRLQQGLLQDGTRLHGRSGESAPKDLPLSEEPIADIEIECSHHFLITPAVAECQISCDSVRSIEQVTTEQSGASQPTTQLDRSNHGGCVRLPEALDLRSIQLREPGQSGNFADHFPGEVLDGVSRPTSVEYEGDQLLI